ncbi:ADP-ribose pyrophosphatase, mitochondrial [Frankliniella fusca]|uniref:ADP-ribose pyrophosphatase, mitochondrial n=1 Tax=Frankliniella fusca TaxID=407009 RepID=A0AAE1LCH6_9NEOP|nr:ADP-ribose pyrophosphatase, mitochondrial [Frankliniella fusca]
MRSAAARGMQLHHKCRAGVATPYSRAPAVLRVGVPDDAVPWSAAWADYAPRDYTDPCVEGRPWADPALGAPGFAPAWNALDGGVDRRSHEGEYAVDAAAGRPLNPRGRTGLAGRGVLGRWGPNHAADPIVTRWRPAPLGAQGEGAQGAATRVLQFVAIRRRDSGEWALPGGMVDPGEAVSATLRREFLEEALNVLRDPARERLVGDFLSGGGEVVYRGYVDDPRNTDNAWMETVASHFHDERGDSAGALPLEAGDDAVGVRWMDLSADLKLYASHSLFLRAVAEKMGVPW